MFAIAKQEFIRGLQLVQGIADSKNLLSVLGNVLLRTCGNSVLTISATDLTVSATCELKANVKSDVSFMLNAKEFYSFVSSCPGPEITVKRLDNNWAEIRSGKTFFKLAGMPDKDFPKIPDVGAATFASVETAPLREMIDRTLFSVCLDESRFHLTGVLLECAGTKARMVSTDGQRLSKAERTLSSSIGEFGIIIPKKGVVELKRLFANAPSCSLVKSGENLFVSHESTRLAIKLISGQFPPYEQVIPKEFKRTITLDRTPLQDVLRRALLVAPEATGIRLTSGDGAIVIGSYNGSTSEFREDLEADTSGGPITVALNPKYLSEPLAQMSAKRVMLLLGTDIDPVAIKPADPSDDFVGIVMPMRT